MNCSEGRVHYDHVVSHPLRVHAHCTQPYTLHTYTQTHTDENTHIHRYNYTHAQIHVYIHVHKYTNAISLLYIWKTTLQYISLPHFPIFQTLVDNGYLRKIHFAHKSVDIKIFLSINIIYYTRNDMHFISTAVSFTGL